MKSRARFFIALKYQDESVLLDFLSLVQNRIGVYDFFTQNMKKGYEGGNLEYLKVLSLKKMPRYREMYKMHEKVKNLGQTLMKKGHARFEVVDGYVNMYQVVTLHSQPAPEKIRMEKEISVRLELMYKNSKFVSCNTTSPEFLIPAFHKFLDDLRRIYVEATK